MEVKVKSRYLHISPRKLRPVINFVRGKNALQAKSQLKFQPNKGAAIVANLLDNALSVVKSSEVAPESFAISAIACSDGPRLKRGQPVSKGRMTPIVKRQSHLTLTLSSGPESKKSTDMKENSSDDSAKRNAGVQNGEKNGSKS